MNYFMQFLFLSSAPSLSLFGNIGWHLVHLDEQLRGRVIGRKPPVWRETPGVSRRGRLLWGRVRPGSCGWREGRVRLAWWWGWGHLLCPVFSSSSLSYECLQSASGLSLGRELPDVGSAVRGLPHTTLGADNKPAQEQPVCLVTCLMGKRAERDGSGGGQGTACGVMVAECVRSGWTRHVEVGRVSS